MTFLVLINDDSHSSANEKILKYSVKYNDYINQHTKSYEDELQILYPGYLRALKLYNTELNKGLILLCHCLIPKPDMVLLNELNTNLSTYLGETDILVKMGVQRKIIRLLKNHNLFIQTFERTTVTDVSLYNSVNHDLDEQARQYLNTINGISNLEEERIFVDYI